MHVYILVVSIVSYSEVLLTLQGRSDPQLVCRFLQSAQAFFVTIGSMNELALLRLLREGAANSGRV